MLIRVEKCEFLFPGARDPTKWTAPFSFVLIADPQLGLFRNNHSWEEELQQVRECVAAAAAAAAGAAGGAEAAEAAATAAESKPVFLLVLGDLTHAPVPAICTGPDVDAIRAVRDQQAKDLKEALNEYSQHLPVLVIPGNHDVGEKPTLASIEDYEQIWGKAHYSFWFGGVKFVCANSSLFYNDSQAPETAEEQFAWIEEEFKEGAEKGAKHIFLLQHHQFYWRNWEEADDRITQIKVRQMNTHNVVATFQLPEKWRLRLLGLLEKYKVSASFHGHLHSDSILKDKNINQIVTTSCGFATNDGRPGWRLVEVEEGEFKHKLIPVEWRTKEYPFLPPRFS